MNLPFLASIRAVVSMELTNITAAVGRGKIRKPGVRPERCSQQINIDLHEDDSFCADLCLRVSSQSLVHQIAALKHFENAQTLVNQSKSRAGKR